MELGEQLGAKDGTKFIRRRVDAVEQSSHLAGAGTAIFQ